MTVKSSSRPNPKKPHAHTGFTLVEMMVVIAILAIMAGIAAPAFRDMIAREKLRSAESALSGSLWLARSEAIKRNTSIVFAFANIGNGWTVTTKSDTATALHVQEPLGGVTSGAVQFEFNAYGRLTSGRGQVQIQATGNSLYSCISISDAGRSTVEHKKCPT